MLPITKLEELPACSGIYRVLDATGTVIYVGQAQNIYKRWQNGHHKMNAILTYCGTAAFIDWVEMPEWLLNRAEYVAVKFYQPILNRKLPPVV